MSPYPAGYVDAFLLRGCTQWKVQRHNGGCTMKSPESAAVSWCIARLYTLPLNARYNQIHSTTKDTIQMQPNVNTEAPSAASCAFHRDSVSLLCTKVHWLQTPAFGTLWSVSYTFCNAINPSYFPETSHIFFVLSLFPFYEQVTSFCSTRWIFCLEANIQVY